MKIRIIAVAIILVAILIGLFDYYSQYKPQSVVGHFPFLLGLDLSGGSHLVYQADVSKVADADVSGAMQSLRDVIENRINIFGVSEPLVETEEATLLNGQKVQELIVELPGVTDVNQAVSIIGQTPILDFRVVNPALVQTLTTTSTQAQIDAALVPTGLTGQYLQKAELDFDPQTGAPQVALDFNSDGTKLFSDITKANVGKEVAILLDGRIISSPVVQQEIDSGQAVISGGNMSASDARTLVQNLNEGALPVPISLIGTETIGASLGSDALHRSVEAGIWGFIVILIFLIIWYRLPGLIAGISLTIYVLLNLALFKLIPVTLTSAGLAGFNLSISLKE